jgi:chromosome segregation ATPase
MPEGSAKPLGAIVMSVPSEEFESFWSNQQRTANDMSEAGFSSKLGNVIRSIGEAGVRERLTPIDGKSSPENWDQLIEHVQSVARQSREADEQLRQREEQSQSLLYTAHKKLDEATETVRLANERASAMEAELIATRRAHEERMRQAEERVRQAEERARQAEAAIAAAEDYAHQADERAKAAEAWLHRLHHTIVTEFADMPTPASVTGPRPTHGIRRVA